MTELNISLWGVGIAVILVVIIYNFWQEYKAKKNVDRAFGQHQDDVLMRADSGAAPNVALRQEPSLDGQSNAAVIPNYDVVHPAVPPNTSSVEAATLPVDDLIDCIIPLEFESPVSGEKILSEIQSFHCVGNKPVHFVGTNLEDQREILSPTASYTHLLAGVQLVTRHSALTEVEYSELVTKLRQIADNLNAFLDIPDMKYAIDAARELHLFVSEHDAQLSVNVKSNGAPWAISTLLATLEKFGFDSQINGRLAMLDGEGGALYSLSTNCGVSEQVSNHITLLLDVPCVAPARGGFNAMVSCAKLLATRLGGSVVDDSNQLLTDETLNQIQEQVDGFYSEMQAAEISAGSVRALRVFG